MYEDYERDYESYELSSSNWLVEHYRAVNREAGHHPGCGFGAGADCSCPKGEFLGFVVRVFWSGAFRVVEIETNAKLANGFAARWRRGGWKVKYTCETFHDSDESFENMREEAEIWRNDIEDKATD